MLLAINIDDVVQDVGSDYYRGLHGFQPDKFHILDTDDFILQTISTNKLLKLLEEEVIEIINLSVDEDDTDEVCIDQDVSDFYDMYGEISSKDGSIVIKDIPNSQHTGNHSIVINGKEYIVSADFLRSPSKDTISLNGKTIVHFDSIVEDMEESYFLGMSYAYRKGDFIVVRYYIFDCEDSSGYHHFALIFDKSGNYRCFYSEDKSTFSKPVQLDKTLASKLQTMKLL